MPPKVSFTRKKILEAAFCILRQEGREGVTIRKIAAGLGASTQPVYRVFSSREQLMSELISQAEDFAVDAIIRFAGEEEPFLGIGLGYLRFADEFPGLFRALYLEGCTSLAPDNLVPDKLRMLNHIRKDPHLQGLAEDQIRTLLSRMWIFTHGLNSLAKSLPEEKRTIFLRQQLHETGGALIAFEHMRKNNPHILEHINIKEETEQ